MGAATAPEPVAAAVASVFRDEAGRVTAALARRFGDYCLADDATQDALLLALERWPRDGIPERPGGWLTTVANRRALNRLKREGRYEEKLAVLRPPVETGGDDRLRLIFSCCHPALARDAQVALTLRSVCGFPTLEIARAFVVSEAAVAQRIVRAKRKIRQAGIPYRTPTGRELGDRLDEVLSVLYLMFNEGHLSTGEAPPFRRNLSEEALWLAELVSRLLPADPEPIGLVALMKLHLARADARFDASGQMVLLQDQDRSLWRRDLISEAIRLIERAAAAGTPGPYQIEAAIAACHAEAASFAETDWRQIVALYDMLNVLAPSPVAQMNRAIAVRFLEGPRRALEELNALEADLTGYHLFHAARGEMLIDLGEVELARAARERALRLSRNAAERHLMSRRLFESAS